MSTPWSREELAGFAQEPIITTERRVRFQDVDAAGTVFFPRMLEYFADAYGELLANAGLDIPRVLRERTLAIPLAHAEADFLAPLFFGDTMRVEVVKARVGERSVTFGHRILKLGGDAAAAAIGTTVHVFVDGKTFKPTPVPDALRAYLSAS